MDLEDSQQVEVILPSGVRYTPLRVGGGQSPQKGLLVRYYCWFNKSDSRRRVVQEE